MTYAEAKAFKMRFGKHKGSTLEQCPLRYLDWLLGWLEDSGQGSSPTYQAIVAYLSDDAVQQDLETELCQQKSR